MANTDIYCVKCRRKTETKNPKIIKIRKQPTLTGLCNVCNTKKFKFVSNQEGEGLLSMLGIKTPLAKIPILGPILG